MKRFLLTAAVIAALGAGLAACETATPYAAAPPGKETTGYGYRDYRVEANRWRVSFAGNSLTSRETVEKYLLYRAAELTLQQGFDWFETTDRHTERNTDYYGSSSFYATYGWGWQPYWGYGGPWGWRTWYPWGGGPFWADTIDIQQVNRYQATAEIMMGKGPPPNGERVFNAHEVQQNLGPSIVRPKTT
jgi:hypothetical protein